MTTNTADSRLFEEVIRELLGQGLSVRFQAQGASMSPAIRDGEVVEVTAVIVSKLRKDDIVLTKSNDGFRLHRIVFADHTRDVFITRGDCGQENDPASTGAQILGLARSKNVRVGRRIVQAKFKGVRGWAVRSAARAQTIACKLLRTRLRRISGRKWPIRFGLFGLLFLLTTLTSAQVAVDSTSSNAQELTGAGNETLTISHTTSGTNRLMLVGVSINITHNTATAVTGVTWNGTALTFVGAHNDAGETRRVEMWSLLAPATGTANVVVTVDIPSAVTEGVSAGVTTFTGVDQTVPLGTFTAADGAAGTNSQEDVPSVVNGIILDTLAIGGAETATVYGPQAQQWNLNTGGSNNRDVTATGSTRAGAPSVPIAETFNNTTNWSLGAISVNPSSADIGVTTSVSAVPLGQNSTYNITVFNNGPSAANSVTLTDTFADTNLSLVSVVPSSGTSCTTTTTINCTLPTPFAKGATATIAVTVSTTAAGFYPNTATVTDSGTPPDFNTGNNSYVALAPVVSVVCSGVTLGPASTPLSGVLNTYYPGTASVTAGATSIPVGTANGTGTIAAGSLLLVIQMQDASINTGDSVVYGNGSTGAGFTTINNAGNYEYVTATGPISGGLVPIKGAGAGSGLVFGYTSAAASGTKGDSTYQVVLVPQYTTATLGAATAAPWNGTTGGILALDIAGQLNLGGASVVVDGMGFRGGAGLQLSGVPNPAPPTLPSNTDYQQEAPATYTPTTTGSSSDGEPGWDASKGEGVAGTPAWVESGGTYLATGTGYPSGGFGAFSLTSVATAAGGTTVYTGTFTGGAGNTLAGYTFVIGGFTHAANNGRFVSTASTATTITLSNTAGVAETTAATANLDGSMGRGAPGNAGGGGTDADPQTASPGGNDQNDGGGGGGNGGSGGFGGDSWSTSLSDGGEGGAAFPATIDRIAMGGGGGAGTRNNSDGDNQASGGSAGGGIIFIRADSLTGTATLTANGINAYNGTANDAGGGGGAGGTIVVLAANGGESGLTLEANGGNGGNAWESETYSLGNRHGPGGGGGGGVVLVSGTPASVSVTGGADGLTENPGVPYGSTPGNAGTSATNATLGQVTGIQSASLCTPDMTLGKSHVGNFTRGTNASYTIPVSNVSPYGASSGVVTVNDTLPQGISPISGSGTGWTCSVSGQTLSCVRSDSLGPASSYPSITLSASVSQTAPAILTNTDEVAGGGEANLLNDYATDVANVVSSADLAVTNSGSPDPVPAGTNITYTQVVTNNGPSAADNATLVTAIPANAIFVSMTAPTGWSCSLPPRGGTGNVVCTSLNVLGVAQATFTLVVGVNAGTANGTVIANTASASSSTFDPNSANNTATVNTVVGGTAGGELTVSNVASPNPVQASNNITYTQVVTNTGRSAATGATFSEATPTNTTFVSITPPVGWSCTGFPATPCSDASVGAGSSGTFTVVYTVNSGTASGTTITDTATVNATNQGFGPNSATATDIVATGTQADLALSTAASPASVYSGNDITYTQTITNNGPAPAAGASFTEATPTNTTFQSVSAPVGWTCTSPPVGSAGTVYCSDPANLASGAEADIIVVVDVPSTVAAGTITASSSVTATTSDPNTSNNSTTVTTPVTTACDLGVTNSGSPNPVAAGSNITYTQVVTNGGPSSCSAGTFNEATPANTTFVSVAATTTGGGTWTCPNTAPVACTNPSVTPGSIGTITAIYKVGGTVTAGTVIADTVTVGTSTHDTNQANNSATSDVTVASTGADLSVTNAGSPNPVTAGNNITYTQSVTNNGPAPANAPVFTETLPANTTSVSLTGPTGWNCVLSSLTCTDTAAMAANTSANFTFVVKVNTGVTSGTTITQTDSVTSTTSDPNNGNNSATVNILVGDSADLSVTNVASPQGVVAGSNIIYTQQVNNAGPSTATSVTLTETAPANTTGVSLSGPTGWTCTLATLTCTDASLAPSSPATITYTVTVKSGTAAGTAISETASVSSAITDPNLTNNTATATDVVALGTQSNLVTTDSASPTSVAAGSNVTYTQSVTNTGPAATNTGMTFTQTTPPNTTFQSITAPTGWTCVTPAMGGTGTITCTDSGSLAMNGSAGFTLVLQVNSGTPSGTNITDTATATVSNIVPGITSNTASATVVVANANSADMAIVKTATPSPTVMEGTPLTYNLAVTNNGPATATDVTVTDTLPSVMLYMSSTTTQGTCSEAGGTVTCLLGTMANAGTATISVLVIPTGAGVVQNTATVTADQTDPNLSNNTSTQTETIVLPTQITLQSFSAQSSVDQSGARRVVLTWKTGGEAHNLGFNVYREQNGSRVRVNPSLIAGSALLMSGALPKHSGRLYTWIDPSAKTEGASYWLEDVDVNGIRTMHGPVTAQTAAQAGNHQPAADALSLGQLNQTESASGEPSHIVETVAVQSIPTTSAMQMQFELAAHPAVKIFVRHEGWYRVTQPDLVKAGLNPNVDPAMLHLYAEAKEEPIEVTGATAGTGGFGPQAAIYFYGTGIDTPFTATRVYWLVAGETPGARIPVLQPSSGSNQPPLSYLETVELRQHTIYFAALLTHNDDNFFGALVSPTPADQVLQVPQFDAASTTPSRLEIALQGVIQGYPHDVEVLLNGTVVGSITFKGQETGFLDQSLPPGLLQKGSNTVTLTAQDGDYDTSLVEYVRITYPHMYVAQYNELRFTGTAGDELTLSGFSSVPTVLDVTDPDAPVQLTPQVDQSHGGNEIAVQVPWTATNTTSVNSEPAISEPSMHTLLAVASERVSLPAAVRPNHPSNWHSALPGADIAMVTADEFTGALPPLLRAHQAEGKSSVIVPVLDLYDEFNFGEHSPFAIRRFLQSAVQNWRKPPTHLLFNGRASLDPRDYLGLGRLDFVPTRIIPTSSLMTASDDWFSDFNDSGMPTIATGRLPVSTVEDDETVIGKIAAYEGAATNGSWTNQALMVADNDDTENFTQDTQTVQAQLPKSMQATDVFAGVVGTAAAREDIINGINSGQLIVNYLGHGSEEQWSGSDIFDENTVPSLTNSSQLPVFLIMDCLNGFFQDVYAQPLGVTLLLAPNGGAVAVLASSGLNQPAPQTMLDNLVVQNALQSAGPTLGESIVKAKSQITDVGVRETFNLLGDPAMQMKQPSPGTAK